MLMVRQRVQHVQLVTEVAVVKGLSDSSCCSLCSSNYEHRQSLH